MGDNVEFYKYLFENDLRPVVVYDELNNMIWYNKSAEEKLYNTVDFFDLKINYDNSFSVILNSKQINGMVNTDKSNFKIAVFESDSVLLGDKRSEDYINGCESVIRRSVAGISASVEIINEENEKSENDEINQQLNAIISNCCGLMRIQEYNRQLQISEKNNDCHLYELNKLLNYVINECKNVFGSNFRINFIPCSDFYINCSKNNFIFLFLNSFRLIFKNNCNFKEITVRCADCDEKAVVSISADTSFNLSNASFSDFSIERFMIKAEADSVNAKINFDESASEKLSDISFTSCSSIGDELKFESPDKTDIYTSNGFFSPYNIMFSDIFYDRRFY